jgi:DNA-binding IclR family transcriptional regulator
MWVIPLLCAVAGLAFLAWCAARVQREIDPTRKSIELFGRHVRPALLRVQDDRARLRRRIDRGS